MSDKPYTLKVGIADDGAVTVSLSDDSGEFYHGRGPYSDGDREAAVKALGHDLATRMAYRSIAPPNPKRIPQELREAVKAGLAYHASTLKDYLQNIADAEAALGQGETP